MKKQLTIVALACMALTACERPGERKNVHHDSSARNPTENTTATSPDFDKAAAQKIRQLILEDETLSENGKNIKITVSEGVVTLKGAVNNERERNIIAQKVRSINGIRNIDNQLEIKRNGESSMQMQNRYNQ